MNSNIVSTLIEIIERIHTAGRPLVVAVTGGGSGAISALLEVPGASSTVLEAIVPYAAAALKEWLGGTPDQYCSERTARAMAMAAFERARKLSDAEPRTLAGIGATASLASNRPKRGAHRIHVAWQSAMTTVVTSSTFPSESTRADEEQACTKLILDAVAEACGILQSRPAAVVGNATDRREQHAPTEWTELLLGERTCVEVRPALANVAMSSHPAKVLFPGAFNPVHTAHRRMAAIASERCGSPIVFELSIANVDKPPLDFVEINERLSQFPDETVLLTRAPTFVEKAALAPGCIFVVGADTVARIGDPKYYGNSVADRDSAIAAITNAGCRFLVFGRVNDDRFVTLSEINLAPALRAICDEIGETDFRDDISSTQLRRQ
jgi:nicotinamide mononucleotide (NMN) deamidase PncC